MRTCDVAEFFAPTAPGIRYVRRPARLFKVGVNYADKGVDASVPGFAQRMLAATNAREHQPLQFTHAPTETVISRAGRLVPGSARLEGDDLWAELEIAAPVFELLDTKALSVSVDRRDHGINSVAVVRRPRVEGAAIFDGEGTDGLGSRGAAGGAESAESVESSAGEPRETWFDGGEIMPGSPETPVTAPVTTPAPTPVVTPPEPPAAPAAPTEPTRESLFSVGYWLGRLGLGGANPPVSLPAGPAPVLADPSEPASAVTPAPEPVADAAFDQRLEAAVAAAVAPLAAEVEQLRGRVAREAQSSREARFDTLVKVNRMPPALAALAVPLSLEVTDATFEAVPGQVEPVTAKALAEAVIAHFEQAVPGVGPLPRLDRGGDGLTADEQRASRARALKAEHPEFSISHCQELADAEFDQKASAR